MTYLAFHFVFILPPILLLALTQRTWLFSPAGRRGRWSVLLVAVIALVYTTPWDNYLVATGVWGYGADRVLATIGWVPVEEYLFFVLQPLLTGLWFLLLARRRWFSEPLAAGRWSRPAGTALWLALAAAGFWALREPSGTYLGLILAWAAPVLAGQWAYAGPAMWARRRLWLAAAIAPSLYLWAADLTAIRQGIWHISEHHTTGVHLFGLPIEEATFFLVTDFLVVQGVFLFCNNGCFQPEAPRAYR